MSMMEKIRQHGLAGSARKGVGVVCRKFFPAYYRWRVRHAPRYVNPTHEDLIRIERDLRGLGIQIHDYYAKSEGFQSFMSEQWFPPGYAGGSTGLVWKEKLLEHWIAGDRLGLGSFGPQDIYVDVAAAGSPWAKELRDRLRLQAFAIDLAPVGEAYRNLSYYRTENATRTSFLDGSVRGISLQCAYEMFMGDDDTRFIGELGRILAPAGKAVILPLYMHTHYCSYASPDYYGKGYSDKEAKEYVRIDGYGIPSSRKYDAKTLMRRVLEPIKCAGLEYRLLALRNNQDLGSNIYCHFILEIEK